MRIPIPEVDERFDCMEDAVEHIVRLSRVIVDKAIKVCPSPSVADIPSYALVLIRKVLIQSSTMVMVARKREDYNTVCALVRILSDNMSILNLIYGSNDDEDKVLRHLLYVMDGVSMRHDMLAGHPMQYDGKIPRETYDSLMKQVEGAIDNAAKCIRFCEDAIKAREPYRIYKNHIDKLIEKRDWKYKVLGSPNQKSYSWKELYEKLNVRSGDEMFPFLSQYVHGLSVSNIVLGDKDDFDAPLSFAVCLLGWLFNFLRREYEPYVGNYTIDDVRKVVPGLFESR